MLRFNFKHRSLELFVFSLMATTLLIQTPSWAAGNKSIKSKHSVSAEDSADWLCPDTPTQLSINLCVSGLRDQQQASINDLLEQVRTTKSSLTTDKLKTDFEQYKQSTCGMYTTIYGPNSVQGQTDRLYCEYDLNDGFINQLRNLALQANGQHKAR